MTAPGTTNRSPLGPGFRLGPYEVLAPLGAGGMGEVYRARDERLGREVAIKVLPPDYSSDPDRLRRFEQEARAAGALNHPNLVSVLDTGQHEGNPYVVFELLDGVTLRQRLGPGPLPVRKAVEYAVQIAQGLAAAHEKGIVHRDLKPENLFVTRDGRVKILDFGLAKLQPTRDPDAPRTQGDTATATGAGMVLGTVGYMSPEQVRGDPADSRSDIFAFGSVLYEVLSGRRPFSGETAAEVMTAILKAEPLELASPEVPAGLERVLRRCLEKRPEERFQSARDVGFALEAVSGASFPPLAASAHRAAKRRWYATSSGAALIVAGTLTAAVLSVLALWPLVPLAVSREPRVTGYSAVTRHEVAFPPFPSEIPIVTDGPRLYFTEFSGGRLSVRQVAVSGGDSTPLPLALADHHVAESVSPDGSEMLVAAWSAKTALADLPYWIVPLVAGAPRRLGNVSGHGAQWLPDGRILFAREQDLLIVGRDGTNERKVVSVPGRPYWPRLSPNGTRIRFTEHDHWNLRSSLWEVRVDGSGLHPLLVNWNDSPSECCGSWTPDGRYFVFSATRDLASHLWAMREEVGLLGGGSSPPVQLTRGMGQYRRPVVSRDGKKLFAVAWDLHGELSRIDPTTGALTPHLSGPSAEWATYSRDSRWVAWLSFPEAELWRVRADGSQRLRLTKGPMRCTGPQWSPDGGRIAFTSLSLDRDPHVMTIDRDGGLPRDVAAGTDPTWSPDGRRLAIRTPAGIAIVDLISGTSTPLPETSELFSPRWSPDGRYLVALAQNRLMRLLLYDFTTRRWRELLSRLLALPIWSADSRYVYFRGDRMPAAPEGTYRFDVRDDSVERIASLDRLRLAWGREAFWLGLAPDHAPLVLRDASRYDLYALDFEAP